MTETRDGSGEDDRDRDRRIGGDKPPPADRGEAGPAGEPEPIDLDSVRDRAS